jgi:5-methylcytosine-specific restriction endonuclease McrA
MKVFVLSKQHKPLMPTTPRRARLWLKAKRARVVCREPFTIQLRFETTAYTQPVTVGVDMGSQTVGVAAKSLGEVVYQAEVALRTAIASKLTQRRAYRRNRRSRKTRYRAARFANRRRPAGWLPPSLRSKAEATVKTVGFVASILPVTQVRVEVGSFDTQKLQNPEISGVAYQQGELQGYLIREYLLAKWKRRCVYCGASNTQLQVEHIIPRARGGSNRASNLTLACAPCNVRKGNQTAAEFGYPEVQAQAKVPLKDAAHVSSIKTVVADQLAELFGPAQVAVTYGYETTYKRIQVLGLAKSHAHDAVAIACEIDERVTPLSVVHQIRCLSRGNYQLYNGKRSEHKVWAPRKVQGWKLFELVEAKGQIGYIGGRRVKGAFVVKDVMSGKTLLEVTPRKLLRLARPMHGSLIIRLASPPA